MKWILVLCALLSAFATQASPIRPQAVEDDIYQLLSEIRSLTRDPRTSYQSKMEIRDGLQNIIDSAYAPPSSRLICTKASNGRFYPTDSTTGQIVGSSGWDAGYDNLNDCRATLPASWQTLACFKQSNGRFYPGHSHNAQVVGSSSWDAGHDQLVHCQKTLPRRGQTATCYKQANGRYYPSQADTGRVIGSSAWDAGYDSFEGCEEVLVP